jgi:hypothetical protein
MEIVVRQITLETRGNWGRVDIFLSSMSGLLHRLGLAGGPIPARPRGGVGRGGCIPSRWEQHPRWSQFQSQQSD